jgi:hypothetical protein
LILTSGVILLFVFLVMRQPQSPVDGSDSPSAAEVPVTPADGQEPLLARVKSLWEQGAADKKERRFADAASAWKKALDLKPGHPGIQEAIDKLPVEVTYILEAPLQAGEGRVQCDIAYLDSRQRRMRLTNVRLPWKMKFLAKKGQALSLAARSGDTSFPIAASVVIESARISSASSFTAWWLGSAPNISCSVKADYQSSAGARIKGSIYHVNAPNPQDDAHAFQKRLAEVMGNDSTLLVLDATVVHNTDILLLSVPSAWSSADTADRLSAAQSFYEIWKNIRQPVFGDQVYLMMLEEEGYRAGGSRYPDGSKLWLTSQGSKGALFRIPTTVADQNITPGGGNGTQGGSSGSSKLFGLSDVERFRAKLKSRPVLEDAIVSVAGVDEDTVKIIVTDKFSALPSSERLALAQMLHMMWRITHSPSNPTRAEMILKTRDGATVGKTDGRGNVEVAD